MGNKISTLINQFCQEPSVKSLLLFIKKSSISPQIYDLVVQYFIEEGRRLSYFTYAPQNIQNFINQLFRMTNKQELCAFILKVQTYTFVKPTYYLKFLEFQYYLITQNYKKIADKQFVCSVAKQLKKLYKILKILKINDQNIWIKTDLIGLCQYIWMKYNGNKDPNKNRVINQFIQYYYKQNRSSFITDLKKNIQKDQDKSLLFYINQRYSNIQSKRTDSFCHHYQYFKGKNEQQAVVNEFQSRYFYIVVSKQLINCLWTYQLKRLKKKQLYWSPLSAEYQKIQSQKYQYLIDVFLDLKNINQDRFWHYKYKVILRNQLLDIEINQKADVQNKFPLKVSMNLVDTAYPQYSHYNEGKKLLLLSIEEWKVYDIKVIKVVNNCIQIPFIKQKKNLPQIKAYYLFKIASSQLNKRNQQYTMIQWVEQQKKQLQRQINEIYIN